MFALSSLFSALICLGFGLKKPRDISGSKEIPAKRMSGENSSSLFRQHCETYRKTGRTYSLRWTSADLTLWTQFMLNLKKYDLLLSSLLVLAMSCIMSAPKLWNSRMTPYTHFRTQQGWWNSWFIGFKDYLPLFCSGNLLVLRTSEIRKFMKVNDISSKDQHAGS